MAFSDKDVRYGILALYDDDGKHPNPANAMHQRVEGDTDRRYGASSRNARSNGRQRLDVKEKPTYVYFMQSKSLGYIKIGHTYDLDKRLTACQTGSADVIEYILTFLVSNKKEAIKMELEFHARFRQFQHHREWFFPDPSLLAFIKENATRPKSEKESQEPEAHIFIKKHRKSVPKTWPCGHKKHHWQTACSRCLCYK